MGDFRSSYRSNRSLPKPSRGLSKSTKTLLIVVVSIMVIVVLFFIIRGIIKKNPNETPVDKLTADLKISEVQILNYTDLNLKIEGDTSAGNVDSVNFVVYGEDGSEITRQKVSIQQLEEDNFQVSLHIANTSEIKEISVTPTFVSESGSKVVGKVEDTYTLSDEEKYSGGESNNENNNSNGQEQPACTLDSDCNDNNSCTTNTCVDGNCSYTLMENCVPCALFSQCNDSNTCTTDVCSEGKCTYLQIPGCTPCVSNLNCEDNNSCTNNMCFQGRCMYTPISDCKNCTLDSDCNDNNSCTTDSCFNNACTHTGISGCKSCTSSSQCEDNDSSTTFTCLNNKCTYSKITSCINNDGYCPTGCNYMNDNDCVYTPICGNGIREGTEKCDGSALGGATCEGVLGAGYTGTLKCTGLCTFNTSLCVAPCTVTCSSLGYNCGTRTICGISNNCGSCTSPQTCNNNACTCTAETNAAFCTRLGKNCGSVTANDNCGNSKTVSSCGTCTSPQTCSNGICVTSTPAATCSDGIQNQGETGIDCGGPCTACTNYLRTFYVSNSGSDSNNGTDTGHPWQTISKVNSHSFLPGDGILFKRGDTWYGTLTVSSSGSANARITYGAYGSGDKPIITGFTTITGWTNYGGGIYSKAVSAASVPFNMVTVDGVNTGKGQYPKAGNWLWNDNVGYQTITASDMPSSIINWAASGTANIFMKTEGYRWNHGLITGHSGTTINYIQQGGETWSGGNGYNGWGFFIDNDLRTLTTINGISPQLGEWFHNGTTFYMYFGAVDPTTKVVKVATLDFGIISHQSYITIDNISFIGFNGDHTSFSNGAINLGDASQYVSVTNCEIGFIGASAIWIGAHTTIDNCYLHDTNGQTILGSNSYFTLTNSLIENIGLIYSSMGGWAARGTVMDNDAGTNQLIQYNIFRHVGSFCAKTNGASNVTIDRNLFDDCVSKAFDAGAIYVNGLSSNRTISNNILINTQGSMEGVSGTWDKNGDPNWVTAEAIYLDQPCTGVTVSGNTCAGTIHGSGIKFGNAIGIIASNNTLYNNYYGFEIGSTGTDYPIRNLQFTNNKIIAGPVVVVAPSMMIFGISSSNDASLWGLTASSGEIYCRPIDDGIDKDFYIWNVGGSRGWDTYAAWKSATGETGSTFSSVTAASTNDILFEYNAAKTNKVITLVGNYKDVKGTSYSGSVTLQPYTSIVLIKN